MLQDKGKNWQESKETCVRRVTELSEVFAGNKHLDGVDKNPSLERWFKDIGKHIDTLQEEDGRKIVQLFQALEEVQGRFSYFYHQIALRNESIFTEFHQLESNLHISQHLADTRKILHGMLRTGNVSESATITLNIITDCCYAWNIMESFIPVMQFSIKYNPKTVTRLKALFLKVKHGFFIYYILANIVDIILEF